MEHPPTPRKKVYIRVLIILISVIVAVAVTVAIALFIHVERMKVTMSNEVNQARSKTTQDIDEQRPKSIASYRSQNIIKDAQPLYSSAVDACYLAHNDSGWTINSHYQECYVRYLEVYETDLNDEQYLTLAMPNEDVSLNIDELRKLVKTCSDDRFELGFKNGTEMGYTSADGTDEPCNLPNQLYGGRVVTYAIPSIISTQTVNGSTSNVTGNKNNIIIVADYSYYKKNIGCMQLSFMCGSPISKPVIGDMKVKN